ncbi:hypothetical protein BOX15_Mlig016384g1 [Macrostomum lignano]|uniref:LITAF domain-containing protein n=1 Tax=Macrostomum lignano TaxID=282301 RepID=A0A267FZT2_9PLAT|nr:hypothetical protein BOX15_Mlig016384g1 [Macrostomum lignano]
MEKGQAPPPAYNASQGGYQPQHYPQTGAPYPPPQQHYPMQQQPQQSSVQVVVQQPAAAVSFNKEPVTTTCPHCRAHITTAVSYVNGLAPWLVSGGLILIGCWLGCCLIPFCIDDLKDAEHRCPNCQQVVGRHRLIS